MCKANYFFFEKVYELKMFGNILKRPRFLNDEENSLIFTKT